MYLFLSLRALLFSPPLPTPQSRSAPQYSGWGEYARGVLGSVLHSWEAGCSLTPSHSPQGRSQSKVALGTTPAAVWEGRVSGKVPLFLSPSRSVPNPGLLFSYFFCSNGVLELFHWTPRLSQLYCCLSIGDCQNQCSLVIVKISVLWEENGRKPYFAILMMLPIDVLYATQG